MVAKALLMMPLPLVFDIVMMPELERVPKLLMPTLLVFDIMMVPVALFVRV